MRLAIDHDGGHHLVAVVDGANEGGGVLVLPDVDPRGLAAVGAEARTTMTLGYGLTRGDLRLGLARSLDGTQPWRLYWGIGAGF